MKMLEKALRGIANRCTDALNDISQFYTLDLVNYAGLFHGIPCTEIVAGFVLRHIEAFNRFSMKSDIVGKYNLLYVTEDAVYVTESYKKSSDETLLRCVLEGFTYTGTVNEDVILKELGIDHDITIRTAPLIYRNSRAGKEYYDMIDGNRPNLNELMRRLDLFPVVLSN